MIVEDVWGLSESSLILIEDELAELLKEDENHERCCDDWESSFGCKGD